MKFYKFGFALLTATMLVACGSSNSTTGLAYNANSNGPLGNQTGCLDAYCSQISIPGGVETRTPLFSGTSTSIDASNKTFNETLPVVPGDRVIVIMPSVQQSSTSFFSTTTTLTSVTAKISSTGNTDVPLGTSSYTQYLVAASGNLKVSIDWFGSNSTSGTHYVNLGYSNNIYVFHCTNTSGVTMPCPQY